MCFTHAGAQPILYPAETLAAAYHTGRPVHTSQLSSSRLGSYSTVASGYAGLAAPSGTLSAAAATTAGTLQPLSHVPSAQSSQFHYIANAGVQHPHGHSVASPGSHSYSSRSGYSQAMNLQYIPQPTLQLQPSVTVTPSYNVGYNPVISTSAPAYTQPQQQQLPTIPPVTGTVQQTLPIYSPPDTISSHSSHLPPHGLVVTQPQQTRAPWNAPTGY
jgi:hypothetical protein